LKVVAGKEEEKGMRLRVIVPILTERWNPVILDEYRRWAEHGTEISIVNVKKGPESIESEYDEEVAAPFVLQEVKIAEQDGMDGVVIFCFGNVATHAAREAVSIPVVGLGEASQLLAILLGNRFSILSTISSAVPRLWRKAKAMGVDPWLISVKAINIPVLSKDEEEVKEALLREGRSATEDGADVIVLGCGTYFGVEKWLEEQLGVPVIHCALAALKIIELLVRLKLSHSKKAFPYPPEKRRIID
jgi:allantoin racemase